MKGTWYSVHGGVKKVKLLGAKKRSVDEEELNTLVASAVEKSI